MGAFASAGGGVMFMQVCQRDKRVAEPESKSTPKLTLIWEKPGLYRKPQSMKTSVVLNSKKKAA